MPELDYRHIERWRAQSRRLKAASITHGNLLDALPPVDEEALANAMRDLTIAGDEYNNANMLRPNDEPDVDPAYGAGVHAPAAEEIAGALLDSQIQSFNRVYDYKTAIEAFSAWCLWLLEINDGVIDAETTLRQFILDAFGWIKG
jgi:hypothetical protein